MTIAGWTYSYPTDTSAEEWAFAAPYLTPEDAGQRRHDLRTVYDALRWIVRVGAAWRLLPGDFPPSMQSIDPTE
jgi:transposase